MGWFIWGFSPRRTRSARACAKCYALYATCYVLCAMRELRLNLTAPATLSCTTRPSQKNETSCSCRLPNSTPPLHAVNLISQSPLPLPSRLPYNESNDFGPAPIHIIYIDRSTCNQLTERRSVSRTEETSTYGLGPSTLRFLHVVSATNSPISQYRSAFFLSFQHVSSLIPAQCFCHRISVV